MRLPRTPLILVLTLATALPARAQSSRAIPAAPPVRFESWRAAPFDRGVTPAVRGFDASSPNRTRHALIGGAIGAAAGVLFCTVISTLADDSAHGGISFCPLDSYLYIGGAGFALGAVIGWAL